MRRLNAPQLHHKRTLVEYLGAQVWLVLDGLGAFARRAERLLEVAKVIDGEVRAVALSSPSKDRQARELVRLHWGFSRRSGGQGDSGPTSPLS